MCGFYVLVFHGNNNELTPGTLFIFLSCLFQMFFYTPHALDIVMYFIQIQIYTQHVMPKIIIQKKRCILPCSCIIVIIVFTKRKDEEWKNEKWKVNLAKWFGFRIYCILIRIHRHYHNTHPCLLLRWTY